MTELAVLVEHLVRAFSHRFAGRVRRTAVRGGVVRRFPCRPEAPACLGVVVRAQEGPAERKPRSKDIAVPSRTQPGDTGSLFTFDNRLVLQRLGRRIVVAADVRRRCGTVAIATVPLAVRFSVSERSRHFVNTVACSCSGAEKLCWSVSNVTEPGREAFQLFIRHFLERAATMLQPEQDGAGHGRIRPGLKCRKPLRQAGLPSRPERSRRTRT